MKTYTLYKQKAKRLLNLKGITKTDVCEYVYGSKMKKSKLCQKEQGKTKLFFNESSKIIEYYVSLAKEIDDIITAR